MKAWLIFSGKYKNIQGALKRIREIDEYIPGLTAAELTDILRHSPELKNEFRKILSGVDPKKSDQRKNKRS